MRNLKKILALVLALVMSMSLLATANAFSDDKDIDATYNEAVSVLSGLKVFEGYENGSFQPKGPITRAEVATIIYRIVTGDVEGKQVGLYSDYNRFDDVKSGSWYAGYVNYCANAELVKGRDGKTFDPQGKVTGYEALAMILRAVGYDKNGEFTGKEWQVQTAAVAKSLGITNNIIPGTLNTAATRETVAEILFRAILVPTVEYTLAYGYRPTGDSLGWKSFKLEQIKGVVVANEYADLYGASAKKAGKTELNVKGDIYSLDYVTTLEDIGEARNAYVTGGTVLYMADAGNTVFETGAETDISTAKKFEAATDMKRGDAESFLNFDNATYEYTTDIRVSYWVDLNNDEQLTDNETGVFAKGTELTSAQVAILEGIFADDDKMDGWVVVGTKELEEKNDVSNDMTWKAFCKEYFAESDTQIDEVNEIENGEWLKVIDNDGDGEADYVLKTEFAMAEITNITSKGVYTISALSNDDAPDYVPDTKDELDVDKDDIVTEDELAEGDIVVYTLIDGNYYVNVAEMVTGTVDKKGINSKTETMTVDGTDYVQSHIGYSDECAYNFYSDVTDGHTEETYDLYLDHFGYVRLFAESAYNKGFVLLTDGYYWTNNRDEEFKATIYDLEAKKLIDVDVKADKNASTFVDDNDEGANGSRGTWDRLLEAGQVYLNYNTEAKDPFITNIAAYAVTDGVYALNDAETASNREDYIVRQLDTDGVKLKDRNIESVDGQRVQTVTSTQYYLVVKDNDGDIDEILTWVGYKNTPDAAELGNETYAYAVTHESDTTVYDVADIVVFETTTTADRDTFFVYEDNNWASREYVWGIGYGADDAIVDDRIDVDGKNNLLVNGPIQFYVIDEDGNVLTFINENYASYNIYAGYVNVIDDTTKYDYFQVADTAAEDDLYFSPEEGSDEYAPIYELYVNKKGEVDVKIMDDWSDVPMGAAMILFTDSKENVEYAIYVGSVAVPYSATDDLKVALFDLWQTIMLDADYTAPTAVEKAIKAAEAIKVVTAENKAAADAAMAELDRLLALESTITVKEKEALTTAKDNLQKLITAYETADKDLNKAKTAAKAKLAACYDGITPSNSQQTAALNAYNANVAKINAAASVEAVEAALTAAIIEMTAFDQDASDADLAGNLIDAGYELDKVVSIMMENDKELTLKEVADAIYSSDNQIGDEKIIPAMLKAGVTPEEIFEGFTSTEKTAPTLAGYMKSTAEADAIVDGYVNYWAGCENPKGVNNMDVELVDGTLKLTMKAAEANISDSDLVDVATAAGLDGANAQVKWTYGGVQYGPESVTSFATNYWAGVKTAAWGGSTVTITVTVGDTSMTVILTK